MPAPLDELELELELLDELEELGLGTVEPEELELLDDELELEELELELEEAAAPELELLDDELPVSSSPGAAPPHATSADDSVVITNARMAVERTLRKSSFDMNEHSSFLLCTGDSFELGASVPQDAVGLGVALLIPSPERRHK